MKEFIITFILITSICTAQSSEADSLNTKYHTIGFDKIQHTAVSCLLTLSGQYIMESKSGFDENKALSYSVGSAVMVGLVKELNDAQAKENQFNWGDMIANGIGIIVAVLIITNWTYQGW